MIKIITDKQKKITPLLLVVLIFVLSIFFIQLPFFYDINNVVLDSLQGELVARDEVIIVAIDDESLQEIGAWPWDRSVFANVVQNISSEDPVAIGFDVLFLEDREGDEVMRQVLESLDTPIIFGSKLIDGTLLHSVYVNSPNVRNGFVNFAQDNDGKIRETKVFTEVDGTCEKSLALSLVQEYFMIQDDSKLCNDTLSLRTSTFAVDDENQLRFAYTRDIFETISIADVLNKEYEPGLFKDRVVMVGSTALDLRSGLNDNFINIFGDNVPGIEVHANIVNSFLQENFYAHVPVMALYAVLFVVIMVLTLLYLSLHTILLDTVVFIVAEVLSVIFGVALLEFDLLYPIISVFLVLAMHYGTMVLYRYLIKTRENKYIKSAFGKYISKSVMDDLLENPENLQLGGELKELTILFSDIRGFTSISEKLSPHMLVQLVNDYLQYMSEIILAYGGTIDKYIGDAVMAFWNAPVEDPDHRSHAIKAALEMNKKIQFFITEHPEYPPLKVGLGINTGNMIVGNIGGENRFDYTALGDNVNLGSRLEGLTKMYGVPIIISEETYTSCAEMKEVVYRKLDVVQVKGRLEPITIYEVRYESEDNRKLFVQYEKAFRLYLEKKMDEALEIFEKITDDDPSSLMQGRCQQLMAHSSKLKDFSGVWRWEEK